MKNLFIIGNGFDLSHGMKTSYEDFHEYLKSEYPEATESKPILPQCNINPDGSVDCSDIESISLLLYVINEIESKYGEWKNFEESLGYLDFGAIFDYLPYRDDSWKEMYDNTDLADSISIAIKKISIFFNNWIDTININKSIQIKKDFVKLINKKCDVFLNFNYTQTLEKLYLINNVCHIHGKQGEILVFGHGNNDSSYNYNLVHYTGAEDILEHTHNYLKKDTNKAIKDNKDFFYEHLISIDNIYSYGFSFAKVDEIYIKEICNILSTENITWYLNDYENIDKRKSFIETIRKCGFKGKFETYNISK